MIAGQIGSSHPGMPELSESGFEKTIRFHSDIVRSTA